MFINLFLGPLLCENLDVRGIPISLGRKLTIALCGMIGNSSQVSVVVISIMSVVSSSFWPLYMHLIKKHCSFRTMLA